jgi:predicted ribosome quality control (RQC) complex YloA/Tae2 family protein
VENFALITVAEELGAAAVGMTVRRVSRYPHRVIYLETRSGRMPGLRISFDSRNPALWIPARSPSVPVETDDFAMVLRKHLLDARLTGIRKPLSERIFELQFRTLLPDDALRHVVLVVELLPNSPNLLLLDSGRHVMASALPLSPRRGFGLFDEYQPRDTGKTLLEEVCSPETGWFDAPAFWKNPQDWLVSHIAGIGPVFAAEIACRAASWRHAPGDVPGGLRALLEGLRKPARTAWVYSPRPLSLIVAEGDEAGLREAFVSPVELESCRQTLSFQTFPGVVAALEAIADPLEDATLVARERSRALKRVRRDLRRLELRRERLIERQRRFRDAGSLRETAQLLVASGADMDRHHSTVGVREYTEAGMRERTVTLDPSRTLRENIRRMFREHRKAGRGSERVARELAQVTREESRLLERQERLTAPARWGEWQAASGPPAREKTDEPGATSRPSPSSGVDSAGKTGVGRKRYRRVTLDGHEVLIGRNSRENDDLTFHVAQPQDFWLHAADYSGSHVVLRNPTGAPEPEDRALQLAAELAAYNSQARNSSRVEVHYTQRKFVTKPRRARPGLVQMRQFRTITVEPRDRTRELTGAGTPQVREAGP